MRELSGVAGARGLPVLTGRAAAGAVAVPFRPLAEAVLAELRRHDLPDLPELRPFRPALGRLVPGGGRARRCPASAAHGREARGQPPGQDRQPAAEAAG